MIAFFLLAYVGVSISFVSRRQDKVVCSEVSVVIPDSPAHKFLGRRDVMSLLQAGGEKWIGEYMRNINTQVVESLVYRNPAVKEVKAFKTAGGKLKIEVTQREPLLRVINRFGDNYYIDDAGEPMPWSSRFTARVLVANGNIPNRFDFSHHEMVNLFTDTSATFKTLGDLARLAHYISGHSFWEAHFEQAFVEEDGDIELIPRVGGHVIILGNIDDMEEKFSNLKLLYEVGLPNMGWNNYSIINLKYRNQVVCTKK